MVKLSQLIVSFHDFCNMLDSELVLTEFNELEPGNYLLHCLSMLWDSLTGKYVRLLKRAAQTFALGSVPLNT